MGCIRPRSVRHSPSQRCAARFEDSDIACGPCVVLPSLCNGVLALTLSSTRSRYEQSHAAMQPTVYSERVETARSLPRRRRPLSLPVLPGCLNIVTCSFVLEC